MNSDNKFGVRHHDAAFMGADASAPRGGRPATKSGDTSPQSKWKPYPKYKDSGVEWLGEVPEGWEVKRLKFTTHLIAGQSPPSDLVFSNSEGLPFLQGNAEFGLIYPQPRFVCDTAPKRVDRSDFLLSVRAPVGALNIADQNYGIGRGLCGIKSKSVFNHQFLFYLLWEIRYQLNIVATGSTYDAVTVSEVSDLPAIIPSKPEQNKIASFLDRETAKIDALLAKKERLIELLQEKRTALITRAVTKGLFGVRPREAAFGGADASAPSATRQATKSGDTSPQSKFKDSGVEWLGKVPEGWEVLNLKRIAFIDYGIGLELDRTLMHGTPIISLPNIPINGELNLSDVPFIELNPNEKKYLLLKKGDLLFNWRNGSSDHVGKTALFNEDGEYTHVSFLLRIRFKSHEFHSKYFHRYLNSLRYTGFFLSTKAGVNNTFNQSELKEMVMIVPPIAEQIEIAEFIEKETFKIDKLIIKIQDCIDKLKEYRTALISAAVTGKIDLCGEAA